MSNPNARRTFVASLTAALLSAALLAGSAHALSLKSLFQPKPPTQTPVVTTVNNVISLLFPGVQLPTSPPQGSVGAPAAAVLTGNAAIIADPQTWIGKFQRLASDGTFTLPWPTDLIKPELVLPSERIAAGGPEDASPLYSDEVDVDGWKYGYNGTDRTVSEFLKQTETDGLLFMRNGKVVDELYANGYSQGQQHQPWSVTKSFISALVGIARDEGRIPSLEAPIETYIPDLRGTNWQGVTIRNILTMQSGIHWEEGTPILPQNTQVQEWVQVWLDYATQGRLGQSRNEFLASLPRDWPQGTKFSYNSGNTQVLAWMLEKIYAKSFAKILSEKLWKPAGMIGNASIITDANGDAIASQGLYALPEDFLRFGELYRRDGRTPDGRQVVSSSWVRESTTFTPLSSGSYGFQWWSGFDADGFAASGFQGNTIAVSRQQCFVGVRLSHTLGIHAGTNGEVTFDPTKLSFGVEMGGGEVNRLFYTVSNRLGGCTA